MQRVTSTLGLSTSVFIALLGCHSGKEVLWSTSVPSPEAGLVAYAEQSVSGGGFGTDYDSTIVELQGTHTAQHNFEVLELEGSGPALRPKMTWPDAQHLEITYTGDPAVNLEVARYGGITINVRQTKEAQ